MIGNRRDKGMLAYYHDEARRIRNDRIAFLKVMYRAPGPQGQPWIGE
jgi:hypothetical protein